MDYKLAKELKDAGYPQTIMYTEGCLPDGKDYVYAPLLHELIEACGDEFGDLQRRISGGEVLWMARQWSMNGLYGEGPTPEEAVVRLWLALNKK